MNYAPLLPYYKISLWLCIYCHQWELDYSSAAAKSLQSCPTLCDPVPGILQARTLEWVAISFFNAWKWKVNMKSLSHIQLLATPWTEAYQAPPSMGFSRQEYWSGVPLPSPERAVLLFYISMMLTNILFLPLKKLPLVFLIRQVPQLLFVWETCYFSFVSEGQLCQV